MRCPERARNEFPPLTNRGVELAEASSGGVLMTDRGPHLSPKKGPLGPWVAVALPKAAESPENPELAGITLKGRGRKRSKSRPR